MSRVVVGIDPGAGGAIGVVTTDGRFCCAVDLPYIERRTSRGGKRRETSPALVGAVLAAIKAEHDVVLVAIEHVGPRPGQSAFAMWTFAEGFGVIRCAVALLRLPARLVLPRVWKKHFGLGKDKEASRAQALQLLPDAAEVLQRKKDEARAEALLIALFAARSFELDGHAQDDATPEQQ